MASAKQKAAARRNIKKAQAALRSKFRGRSKKTRKVARRSIRASRRGLRAVRKGPRPQGIVAKVNKGLRGLKLALPLIGTAIADGLSANTPDHAIYRYTGYHMRFGKFDPDFAGTKTAAGFFAGNIIESKIMSLARIPQMAGRKKILAIVANYLPEVESLPHVLAGNYGEAVNTLGRRSIGYQATDHQSFIENPTVRAQWLGGLGARVGLGLFSRFVGPMVNKYLPKGVNI